MTDDPRSAPTTKDGFRKRRKRPKGWLKKAIASGEVRDPNLPPEEHTVYPDQVTVISVPVGTMDGAVKE